METTNKSAENKKPSEQFIDFIKTKYEQKDHNTMYLFDNMIDALYQGVLYGLINECFSSQQNKEVIKEIEILKQENSYVKLANAEMLIQQQDEIKKLNETIAKIRKFISAHDFHRITKH